MNFTLIIKISWIEKSKANMNKKQIQSANVLSIVKEKLRKNVKFGRIWKLIKIERLKIESFMT